MELKRQSKTQLRSKYARSQIPRAASSWWCRDWQADIHEWSIRTLWSTCRCAQNQRTQRRCHPTAHWRCDSCNIRPMGRIACTERERPSPATWRAIHILMWISLCLFRQNLAFWVLLSVFESNVTFRYYTQTYHTHVSSRQKPSTSLENLANATIRGHSSDMSRHLLCLFGCHPVFFLPWYLDTLSSDFGENENMTLGTLKITGLFSIAVVARIHVKSSGFCLDFCIAANIAHSTLFFRGSCWRISLFWWMISPPDSLSLEKNGRSCYNVTMSMSQTNQWQVSSTSNLNVKDIHISISLGLKPKYIDHYALVLQNIQQ